MMPTIDFLFHNLTLPDDLVIWTAPHDAIRRWDERAHVYDVIVGPNQVLGHYAFYDRWFEVNCSLDATGQFIEEPGLIDWCFNIDMVTPLFTIGACGYNIDLCVDVLAAADGRRYFVKDENEFEAAIAQGWITDIEREGALSGLAEVERMLSSGQFVPFLEGVCPFPVMPVIQPPMQVGNLATLEIMTPGVRERYFGRRL